MVLNLININSFYAHKNYNHIGHYYLYYHFYRLSRQIVVVYQVSAKNAHTDNYISVCKDFLLTDNYIPVGEESSHTEFYNATTYYLELNISKSLDLVRVSKELLRVIRFVRFMSLPF